MLICEHNVLLWADDALLLEGVSLYLEINFQEFIIFEITFYGAERERGRGERIQGQKVP
jgi:hypothetical protein